MNATVWKFVICCIHQCALWKRQVFRRWQNALMSQAGSQGDSSRPLVQLQRRSDGGICWVWHLWFKFFFNFGALPNILHYITLHYSTLSPSRSQGKNQFWTSCFLLCWSPIQCGKLMTTDRVWRGTASWHNVDADDWQRQKHIVLQCAAVYEALKSHSTCSTVARVTSFHHSFIHSLN